MSRLSGYQLKKARERAKERKREAWRKHAEKHYEEVREAKESIAYKPKAKRGGGNNDLCSSCEYLQHCRRVVWTGEILPCQPQDQEAVMLKREDGDYASWEKYEEWPGLQF